MFECLLEEFNYQDFLDKIVREIAQKNPHENGSAMIQIQSQCSRFCELSMLRSAFATDFVSAVSSQDIKGWYALTFCLRFHITWMNFFISKMQDNSLQIDSVSALDFFSISNFERVKYLDFLSKKLKELTPGYLPVLGFSPLGVHVRLQELGFCRAFDRDVIAGCCEKVEGIFCTLHSNETWWLEAKRKQWSKQAIMYQFYSDPENFYLYNQTDLENFVGKFWSKMRSYQTVGADEVKKSLKVFGLLDQQELLNVGAIGLRKIFLQKSLEHHPDMGGEQEQFVSLRESYEVLKYFFS